MLCCQCCGGSVRGGAQRVVVVPEGVPRCRAVRIAHSQSAAQHKEYCSEQLKGSTTRSLTSFLGHSFLYEIQDFLHGSSTFTMNIIGHCYTQHSMPSKVSGVVKSVLAYDGYVCVSGRAFDGHQKKTSGYEVFTSSTTTSFQSTTSPVQGSRTARSWNSLPWTNS